MTPPVDLRPAPGSESVSAEVPLRRRYEHYRARQARDLLHLVPREAVRPLLGAARRAAVESAAGADLDDGLALLTAFCEQLLPLPPFEVWLEDFQAHRTAHLESEEPEARGPVAEGPVTTAFRSFRAHGETWYASLEVRPAEGRWTGSLRYHGDAHPQRSFRTAEVFREADADAVRTRFLEFDEGTLQAFLRSVLP